ncbi:MAG TPA: phospholipase D family protein [Xanthomonadaceae bacterium]|nr:phospholipase D family protein [Xanthomonadaceae bacterium]
MDMHRTSRLALALSGLLLVDAAYAASDPPAAASSTTLPLPATVAAPSNAPAPATSATLPSPATVSPATAPPVTTADGHTVVPAVVAKDKAQTQPTPQKHEAPAIVKAQGSNATPKEQAAAAQSASPAAPSGFRLMTLSSNALLSRVSLADQAKHTIDLQYFIFENDATGRLIALHLLQAADRGVHVRMLIDDLNVKDDARMFKALDAHPNIEVKLFNPFHSGAASGVSKAAQMLGDFERLNHRMHNKDFIVDNQVAIIGGRNIGDAYFDAKADTNFRDLDLIAIGPVVPAATATFEAYWNSDAAHPMAEYRDSAKPETAASDAAAVTEVAKADATKADATKADGSVASDTRMPHPTSAETAGTTTPGGDSSTATKSMSSADPSIERAYLEKNARTFEDFAYKEAAANDLPNGASADRPGNWYWGPANLVADQPEKIDAGPERTDLRISPQLNGMIKEAKSDVLVISPYFVPTDTADAEFVAVAQRGVAFKVLTNSLASTDELAVYNGYAKHRRKLLAGGVQLYELKPAPGVQMAATDVGQSAGVALHAKSIVVDNRYVFIGSLNMDVRSKLLNTEMGVVVDSPQLAKAVAEFFATATLPANAYHVVLGAPDGTDPSGLHWEYNENGKDIDAHNEPDASLGRRAKAKVMKLLPMDGLL